MALPFPTSSQIIPLHARREAREAAVVGRELETELGLLRERLVALATAGTLFAESGSREGRRLLRTQELLLEARAHLVERAGAGPLPAPRHESTRAALLEQARGKLAAARARLAPPARPDAALTGSR